MAGLVPDTDADLIRLRLDPEEVDVLVSLVQGLAVRVESAAEEPDPADPDPVIARLTPTVSRGDADVDDELRAMLRDDLLTTRSRRLSGLSRDLRTWAGGAGGAIDRALDRDAAMRIVEALNDVRLALASTIGYDDQLRETLAPGDGRAEAVALMDALAWLQGGLIEYVEGGA
jgi:hypothetical protein